VVTVRDRQFVALTALSPPLSALLDRDDLVDVVRTAPGGRRWPVAEVTRASRDRNNTAPHLLAPIDLQVIKAAGVTFVRSLLERVIEERAKGDPTGAAAVRQQLVDTLGGALGDLVPGSTTAVKIKDMLIAEGLWSQYLEVGIGPDPEIFTKAPGSAGSRTQHVLTARRHRPRPRPARPAHRGEVRLTGRAVRWPVRRGSSRTPAGSAGRVRPRGIRGCAGSAPAGCGPWPPGVSRCVVVITPWATGLRAAS